MLSIICFIAIAFYVLCQLLHLFLRRVRNYSSNSFWRLRYKILAFKPQFQLVKTSVNFRVIGTLAVLSNLLNMFLTIRQSSSLSSEYVRLILILKVSSLMTQLLDNNTSRFSNYCTIFIRVSSSLLHVSFHAKAFSQEE